MELITSELMIPVTNGDKATTDAGIAVENGRIVKVASRTELETIYPEAIKKHYEDAVLMPGLVCAYSRPGLASYRRAGKLPSDPIEMDFAAIEQTDKLTELDTKNIAKNEITRLMKSGVTCLGIQTSYHGTFSLVRDLGVRAVVMPEITGGLTENTQDSFEAALALLEECCTKELIKTGLAPASPYLLSRHMLKLAAEHAHDANIPIFIRASSSFAEMEFFFDSQGPIADFLFPKLGWQTLPAPHRQTPIQYLSEIGTLKAKTTIVGGLHIAGKDFTLLARHGARVVWCPKSQLTFSNGKFPWKKLKEFGIPIAFGVDDWAFPETDMWAEMRSALEPKASDCTPCPWELLFAATLGGARALRLEDTIGSFEEGKFADYIVVKKPKGNDLAAALINETDTPSVIATAIKGNETKLGTP